MEAQRVTGAPVQVHCARIEELVLPPAPLVTARALAPLDRLLELAAPLLAPGGTGLFPKGARVGRGAGGGAPALAHAGPAGGAGGAADPRRRRTWPVC